MRSPDLMGTDIEQLLQWAYRDELVKRMNGSAEAIWAQLDTMRQVGTYERTGVAQRYDLDAPHPDALAIERAVALLPDQVIDWEKDAEPILGHLMALVEPRAGGALEPAARRPTK